jgi:hypothetical protein
LQENKEKRREKKEELHRIKRREDKNGLKNKKLYL